MHQNDDRSPAFRLEDNVHFPFFLLWLFLLPPPIPAVCVGGPLSSLRSMSASAPQPMGFSAPSAMPAMSGGRMYMGALGYVCAGVMRAGYENAESYEKKEDR